ncbi:MAG: M48 family metallopeptidase [Corallococcus sp.]|nr:M48 family metallopeptidase [Corallococcus sp.]MCM1359164.1 M48 family metallopeptidase [Corallococcus sp.]MCM1394554.1 M48 family metallopeptidase [Corallococcus sp.]
MRVVVSRTHKKIVSLHLGDNGVLYVLANRKLSLAKVKQIVESKREWINEQIKLNTCRNANDAVSSCNKEACAVYAVDTQQQSSKIKCTSKESSTSQSNIRFSTETLAPTQNAYYGEMFSGKKCLLCGRIHKVMPTAESKCHLDANCIYVPQKYFSDKASRIKALKGYIKKLSTQNVSNQISKFGSHASLCPTKIEFRNLSVGWTKCTTPTERVIALDYRICQLPPNLQHYIIVHAFAHFTNATHDDDFWNTVSNHLPYYKDCLDELAGYEFLKDI